MADQLPRLLRRQLCIEQLPAMHASGLTDAAIARSLHCGRKLVFFVRRSLYLPPNVDAVRVAQSSAGHRTRSLRSAHRQARTAALKLPVPLNDTARRIVLELASGPAHRSALATRLGRSPYKGSSVARSLIELVRSGTVTRSDQWSGRVGRSRTIYSLSSSTVSTAFARDTLAPLQFHLASSPAIVSTARTIASSYFRSTPAFVHDEILSSAHAGIVDAARLYDPSRRVPFESYAATRIRGAILDALRSLAPTGYSARRSATVPLVYTGHCHDAAPDLDFLAPPRSSDSSALDRADFLSLTESLPFPIRTIFALRFCDALPWSEIASRVGLTRSRVFQLYNEGLNHMRNKLTSTI